MITHKENTFTTTNEGEWSATTNLNNLEHSNTILELSKNKPSGFMLCPVALSKDLSTITAKSRKYDRLTDWVSPEGEWYLYMVFRRDDGGYIVRFSEKENDK